MGTRYTFKIVCPECGNIQSVYYAPTCGFTTHRCSFCGHVIDLTMSYEWIGIKEAKQRADDLLENSGKEAIWNWYPDKYGI